MKKAIVDFSKCQSIYEIHEQIKESLNFPDYYGNNLDAFWDCINRDCYIDFVTIKGSKDVLAELKPTVEKIIEMLEENKQYWKNSDSPFDYEILS